MGQQFGMFGQQQNQLTYYQNGQAPKSVAFHKPRGKSMEFLATVAKLAGAYVPENKGKGDVLVYAGDEETTARAKRLLEEVDIEAQTLSVRAALLEFTEGDNSSKSLSLALSALGGKLGANYQAGSPLSNAITWNGVNIQAALGLIDGDRRFKYLAETSLRVADGEQARFVVGSEVPVRASAVKDQGGNAVQSVEYKTAGVVVTVEPKVMKDSIRIRVGQQVSSFALTTTSNIDSPTILKREADTVVNVMDGELVILAGMDEKTENQSRSGGWGFPALFWGAEKNNSRLQLLLMLEVKKIKPSPLEI
jgi:general secretion pathway protein D